MPLSSWQLASMFTDLRYGLRMLVKNPGFTIVAVFTLALGIGANTAIFSVIHAVLLHPVPWKDPDRIVNFWETNLKRGVEREIVSPANFLEWRDQNQIFEQTAAWRFQYFNLTGRDEPERVQGLAVSPGYFPLLRVKPALGRTFLSNEELPGYNHVVVVSHGFWQRRFSSDPNLVGQKITIEGEPHTVVGILPGDFLIFKVLNRQLDLFVPFVFDRSQLNRQEHSMFGYARLKPGVSLQQAQAEMDAVYSRLEREYPSTNIGWGVKLIPLPEQWVERIRPILLMLFVAVGFVLLIACFNIVHLQLARATVRQKEMAIRSVLGANRSRVIRLLLTENLLLAGLGGAVGLILAFWGIDLLNHFIPYQAVNRVDRFRVNGQVLGFTAAISLLAGIPCGIVPAIQSSKQSFSESLKEGAARLTRVGRAGSLSHLLVVSEIALAMVLLIGAGLLIKSSWRLQGVYRGLDVNNVLTMQIWLPQSKYQASHQVVNFFRRVLRRVEALPGVESSGVVNFPPLALQSTTVEFIVEGRTPTTPQEVLTSLFSVVSPSYFRTLRIPLVAGRQFTEQDADEERGVVMISQAMASRFWPGENPLERRIRPEFPKEKTFWIPESKNLQLTVVGIVGDVRQDGLGQTDLPHIYLPYLQNPSSMMTLLVRTASDPMRWAAAVRGEVTAEDHDQPVFDVKTMKDILAESFSQPRVFAFMLGSFAALALLLSAAGIYGVMSYSVVQRTREIGLRMALGAQTSDILNLFVGQGLVLALIGVACGLIAAFGLTRFLSSLLCGVSSMDPAIFAMLSLFLIGIVVSASSIPAHRAAKIDSIEALRHE
jgi:putative ABC transport system permease protein